MIRRKKEDTLDLPEKNYITVYVDAEASQAKLYKQAKEELRIEVPGDPNPLELQSSLVAAGKIRMIASTPWTVGAPDRSYKLDVIVARAIETIENGDRPIIFTEYRKVIEALEIRFAKAGIDTWSLHGGVKMDTRVGVVDDWGTSPPGALIAMISVAGVGLNMAAYSSTIIFATKSWTPASNGQAIDRVHRVGADMTKPVTIIDVIVKDTIEERVEEVNSLKTALSDSVVDGGAPHNQELKKKLFDALKEELDDD